MAASGPNRPPPQVNRLVHALNLVSARCAQRLGISGKVKALLVIQCRQVASGRPRPCSSTLAQPLTAKAGNDVSEAKNWPWNKFQLDQRCDSQRRQPRLTGMALRG